MADSLDHLSSGRTQIEWLSSLNTEFKPKTNYRRTSIICTIGMLSCPPGEAGGMSFADLRNRPKDQFGRQDQHAT